MTTPLMDYHLGLIRGFLLAHKADQQLHHALKAIAEGRSSRAGDVIGQEQPATEAIMDSIRRAAEVPAKPPAQWIGVESSKGTETVPQGFTGEVVKEPKETAGGRLIWTNRMVEQLTSLYHEGKKVKEIAAELNIASHAKVYNRITTMIENGTLKAREKAPKRNRTLTMETLPGRPEGFSRTALLGKVIFSKEKVLGIRFVNDIEACRLVPKSLITSTIICEENKELSFFDIEMWWVKKNGVVDAYLEPKPQLELAP